MPNVSENMGRSLQRLTATGAIVVAVFLCVCGGTAAAVPPGGPAEASGGAGPAAVLDPSFGSGGLVRVPLEAPASATLGASTQSGSLVVSGGASLQLLNDIGGTGEAFGGVGSLALPSAEGREFVLGGFTLDPQGRLVVVGSSRYPEAENASPKRVGGTLAFRPAALRILRFLPGGGLDPSFGQDGVVETDLGLPAPLATDGRRRLGSHPAERATGVAVGPDGRIVVTGTTVVRLGNACEPRGFAPGVIGAGFVARFDEDGARDATFGKDGLVGGRHFEELPLGAKVIEEPVVAPTGTITYRSSAVYRCAKANSHIGIAQLTPKGQARSAFGKKGASVGRYDAITGGSGGSVFALQEVPRRGARKLQPQVTKFAPGGRPAASFGTDGRAAVGLGGEFDLNSLTVDDRDRVLLGGWQGGSIVLLRLSAAGSQERNFGPHGRVSTHVPGLGFLSTVFFDDKGRLVTVDPYANRADDRQGLVVARYLLRH